MIEIRTYDGDMRQLAEFCNGVWARRYQGQMPYARWTPEFLEWELDDAQTTRELLVAAYDGAKLVGVLPARPMRFHLQGETLAGSWGSYFSVDPDYENQPVSIKLHIEQRRRHKERGLVINFGYVVTAYSAGRGQQFWLKQQKLVKPIRHVGMWVRALDPQAVARFSMRRLDVLGLQLSKLVLGDPRPPRRPEVIRSFVASDAPACAALLDAASRRADLGYAWDAKLAERQLAFKDVTRTLVVDHDGRVAGLINYSTLPLIGRAPILAGVIDFLETTGLPMRTAVDLVRAALCDMRSRGVHLAMALRISAMPRWPLARTAFTMLPAEYCYVAQPIDFARPDWRFRRLHVHWR
jgi:hypothetical protein